VMAWSASRSRPPDQTLAPPFASHARLSGFTATT